LTVLFFIIDNEAYYYGKHCIGIIKKGIPLNVQINRFEGQYSVFDAENDNWPIVLVGEDFPIAVKGKKEYQTYHINRILAYKKRGEIFNCIASTSKGLQFISISERWSGNTIINYDIEEITSDEIEFLDDDWINLMSVPVFFLFWKFVGYPILVFISLLLCVVIITQLPRVSSRVSGEN